MIEFRQKDFSILNSTLAGASSGFAVGSLVGKAFRSKSSNQNFEAIAGFSGFIGGAALGALAGVIDNQRTKFNRKKTVDDRLMDTIVENLKKDNFKDKYICSILGISLYKLRQIKKMARENTPLQNHLT